MQNYRLKWSIVPEKSHEGNVSETNRRRANSSRSAIFHFEPRDGALKLIDDD